MTYSAPSTYNRKAFYTIHGVAVILDLIVIGICAWVVSDTVQGQVDIPRGGRHQPIVMLVAASIAALWSSIVIGLAGMKVVTLPIGVWYTLLCNSLVTPLYLTAMIMLAARIGRVGTCKSDGPVFTDYIIESCSEFWHKLQRVQIVAVVLAGIVIISLFVESLYTVRMDKMARNKKSARISLA